MKSRWLIKGAKFLVAAFLAIFGLGFIVMVLWNALIPDIFKGPALSYWQAMGLLLLSHLLLRGWSPWRSAHGWRRERWRRRFEEKMASMTPEEREKFSGSWDHRHNPAN